MNEDSHEGGGGGVAVKSERDNRDAVEQLLGQSLLSSAALTSVSPDYTTLFPYCILLQLNISMSVFLLHTLHVYLISLKRHQFSAHDLSYGSQYTHIIPPSLTRCTGL